MGFFVGQFLVQGFFWVLIFAAIPSSLSPGVKLELEKLYDFRCKVFESHKKSGKLETESDLLNSHNQKNDLLNIPTFPIKSQGFVKI